MFSPSVESLYLGFYMAWAEVSARFVWRSPGVNAFVIASTPGVAAFSAMSVWPVWEVLQRDERPLNSLSRHVFVHSFIKRTAHIVISVNVPVWAQFQLQSLFKEE